MKRLTICALLVFAGCAEEKREPRTTPPEPKGDYQVSGEILLNERPLAGIPVLYRYSWMPGTRGSRERAVSTDTNGHFSFGTLPELTASLSWTHSMPNSEMKVSQRVNPSSTSNLTWSIVATSRLSGTVGYAQPASMPRPATIRLFRVAPSVVNVATNWTRPWGDENPRDFAFSAKAMLDQSGSFVFTNLPAGTYGMVAPPTMIIRGNPPRLFSARLVKIDEEKSKTIAVNPGP